MALSCGLAVSQIVELMEEMDVDGNGTVEFEEFLTMMTRKEEKVTTRQR